MGIMLIDASAEGQEDTRSLLNFPQQATPALNAATRTTIGLPAPLRDEDRPMAKRVSVCLRG